MNKFIFGLLATAAAILSTPGQGALALQNSWEKFGDPISQMERDWVAAHTNQDAQLFERTLAADYTLTAAWGQVEGLDGFLKLIKSGDYAVKSMTRSKLNTNIHPRRATVSGRLSLEATHQGADISGQYSYTNVYLKKGGRWQLASTQLTRAK
jgi:ketosteroid isomerase-like protein